MLMRTAASTGEIVDLPGRPCWSGVRVCEPAGWHQSQRRSRSVDPMPRYDSRAENAEQSIAARHVLAQFGDRGALVKQVHGPSRMIRQRQFRVDAEVAIKRR